MKASPFFLLLAIAATLFVAGCGGGDSGPSNSSATPMISVATYDYTIDEVPGTEAAITITNPTSKPMTELALCVWDDPSGTRQYGVSFLWNAAYGGCTDSYEVPSNQHYWEGHSWLSIDTGSAQLPEPYQLPDDVFGNGVSLPDLAAGKTMNVFIFYTAMPVIIADPAAIKVTYADPIGTPDYYEGSDTWSALVGNTLVFDVVRSGYVGRSIESEWYLELYRYNGPFNWDYPLDEADCTLAATYHFHDGGVDNSVGERWIRAEYTPAVPGVYLLKAYDKKEAGRLVDYTFLSVHNDFNFALSAAAQSRLRSLKTR